MALQTRILLYRGAFAHMPLLAQGEMAFATDTKQVYIGDGVINRPVGGARVPDGDKGDITVADSGDSWHINARAVGPAEFAAVANKRVLGRNTAGSGDLEEATVDQLLDWVAGTPALGDMLVRGGTTWQRIPLSTFTYANLSKPNIPSTAWVPAIPIVLEDQKSANTAGGTSSSTSWQTRTLNTKVRDLDNLCTLTGNAFSLPKGMYRIVARAPAYNAGMNRLRLTQAGFGTVGLGAGVFSQTTSITLAVLDCVIGCEASDAFTLQHYITTGQASNGLGVQMNDGSDEVYAQVVITPLVMLP